VLSVVCVVLVLSVGHPVSAGSCMDCYQGCRNICDAKAEADCGGGPFRSAPAAECVRCMLRTYLSCKEPCDMGCSDACNKVLGLSSLGK
jgi:hypothetical protein